MVETGAAAQHLQLLQPVTKDLLSEMFNCLTWDTMDFEGPIYQKIPSEMEVAPPL